jgi:thiamine pyrophosphokinase
MPDLLIARPPRHVVVVADGDLAPRAALDAAWPGWDHDVAEVIAADGGLVRARAIGLEPGVLVGDLDSLGGAQADAAAAAGLEIRRSSADKDESDTELALLEAVARGATRITVLGALGGPRLDHALANLWLLGHPALNGIDVAVLDPAARVSVLPGPATRALPGPVGGTVSLLPLGGDAEGITTHGFRYPLRDEPLRTGPARGLSNVRTSPDASVTLRQGRLLVVESADAAPGLDSSP